MEFKELEEKIMQHAIKYGEKYNIKIDTDFALLKLYEEVGELAQAVLIDRRQSRPKKFLPPEESKQQVALELADVVGMAIVNAKLLDINLEEVLIHKWLKKET